MSMLSITHTSITHAFDRVGVSPGVELLTAPTSLSSLQFLRPSDVRAVNLLTAETSLISSQWPKPRVVRAVLPGLHATSVGAHLTSITAAFDTTRCEHGDARTHLSHALPRPAAFTYVCVCAGGGSVFSGGADADGRRLGEDGPHGGEEHAAIFGAERWLHA